MSNIKLVKYFSGEQYPVKIIGDGPANDKGVVEATIIRVSPTPFGSPTHKDLHGQFFISGETPTLLTMGTGDNYGTYFGDDVTGGLKFGLYEHFMNALNNPEFAKFGPLASILGPAKLVKLEDDPTRWFDIEVRRSINYHDFMMQLIDMKIMGSSTQAFMNSVVVNEEGGIPIWIENEVGPTVNPASPDTIKAMKSLWKTAPYLSLPAMSVKMFKADALVDVSIDDDLEPAPEPVAEPALSDQIAEIFSDAPEEPPATPAAAVADTAVITISVAELEKMIATQVKAYISVVMDMWGETPEEAREGIAAMLGLSKNVPAILQQVLTSQGEMSKSFLMFARQMKALTKSTATAEVTEPMSELEREIFNDQAQKAKTKVRNYGSVAPQGAPGTY